MNLREPGDGGMGEWENGRMGEWENGRKREFEEGMCQRHIIFIEI